MAQRQALGAVKNRSSVRSRGLSLIAVSVMLYPFGVATAQDKVDQDKGSQAGTPASSPPTDDAKGLEDIIVTAQRRSENLQRVPISISAFTAGTIEKTNITNTASLQQITPGLTNSVSVRSSLPFIRGVGSTDASVGSENPVALYVDGVYIDSSQAAAFSLNNIERIEVLKGPQGTLFGRNATGGLISITTRTPSRTLGLDMETGFANYDTVRSSLYLTGPITATLAADLAVTYSDQGKGWGHNLNTGADVHLDNLFATRSKWLLDLGATRITLVGDYSKERTDSGVARNIPPGAINPGNTTFHGGFYDSQSDVDPLGYDSVTGTPLGVIRQTSGSLRIEQDFPSIKLTSITAYRDTFYSTVIDQDETPLAVFNSYFDAVRTRTGTQELQLTSRGSGPVDWIVGGFFMHRHGFQPLIRLTGAAFAGAPFLGEGRFDDGVTTDTGAPYAQATWHVGARTDLTGGVRYTIEHQHFEGVQTTKAGATVSSVDSAVTYRKFTFRAAASQRLTDAVLVYASFNRGSKGGVYNVNNLVAPPARPEQLDAIELGVKSDLFDRKLRLNGALFRYNYTDIQLLIAPPPGSGQISTTINAAKARIFGGEATIEARPTSSLLLSLGGSYMPTAKYLSFPNAPFYSTKPGGGANLLGFDDSGQRMVRAPRFTGTASVDYLLPTRLGKLDANVNGYHSSAIIWNPDARYVQPSYNLLNAQLTLDVAGTSASISLWGRNLLDKKYEVGVSETASGDAYVPGAPRTYGFKLRYRFQ